MLTLELMRSMWPKGNTDVSGLVEAMVSSAPIVFPKYGLTSKLVIAHAMAQFSHECGAGTDMVENINYTPQRACEVWPKRFKNAADCLAKVGSFAGDPDFKFKLINSVYGDRNGNRPGTTDGTTFIGRGLSQVTGRDNYDEVGKKVGLDLVTHPDLVIKAGNALECAVADFVLCRCVEPAKADDVTTVTRRLNGGTVGLEDRAKWLVRWKTALGVAGSAGA